VLGFVREKYEGKKVFITGHNGFKGTWLSFLLSEIGAEVAGFSNKEVKKEDHFSQLGLSQAIRNYSGDIRQQLVLSEAIDEFEPDFVFHLAAQALVRSSYDDPEDTFSTNVMGSVNLLNAVRSCPSVKSLVFVTSDKCYQNNEWVWGYRENDRLGGKDPYSASKAAAELVFESYKNSFLNKSSNLGAASVRAGNVVGGGDWSQDRIIPDCVRAIISGKSIELRNPQSTRPWQHVLEPISGYVLLGAVLSDDPIKFGGAWNFGPKMEKMRTVEQIASIFIDVFGKGSIVKNNTTPGDYEEATLLQLNCEKAHQILKWQPKWNVDEAIEHTVEWYKRTLSGEKATTVTRQQLELYFGERL